MDKRTYHVSRSTITLLLGDITRSTAEVLVSSDDDRLSMGGGVSAVIRSAAGQRVSDEAQKMMPARVGDVVITSAGDLPTRYIMHAVTLRWPPFSQEAGSHALTADALVRLTTRRAMQLLPLVGCRSIAFPAIGTGLARISPDVVAMQMASVLVRTLLESDAALQVELYLSARHANRTPDELFASFEQHLERTLALVTAHEGDEHMLQPEATVNLTDPEQAQLERRRQQVFEILRRLDARQRELDLSIQAAIGKSDAARPEKLADLAHLQSALLTLRRGYQDELIDSRKSPALVPNSVFLSSTWMDLQPHREEIVRVVRDLGYTFIGMEDFTPSKDVPRAYLRGQVARAEIYLGVFAMRYGSVDAASGLSMTELEYREARIYNKEIYAFMLDPRAQITAEMFESNPENLAKLNALKAQLTQDLVIGYFKDPAELATKVRRTLLTRHRGGPPDG